MIRASFAQVRMPMKKSLITSACLTAAWALCGTAAAAQPPSKTMFKCVDAAGVTTFQALPCTAGAKQSEVKLREPVKESGAQPEQAPEIDPETGLPVEPKPLVSYECTTAQGWTFYKHRPCPPGVRVPTPGATTVDASDTLAATQGEWIRVSGAPVPRLEACRRIAEGPARKGHVFDDVATERDRAAGNDPCLQK